MLQPQEAQDERTTWGKLHHCRTSPYSHYVEIKCQLDATDDFYCRSYCLLNTFRGTIMSINRSSRLLYKWLLPVVFGALVFKLSVWCGAELCVPGLRAAASNHLYNTLELLMMGIMVPETCWASNKICNKNHLFHLVGILFPHISTACFDRNHPIVFSGNIHVVI